MENQEYSMYEITTMTPGMASKVLLDECKKEKPNIELIQNILEFSPVNVNVQRYKQTALIWASYRGHTEIVQMLLQRPEILVNVQDEGNFTALIWASYFGYTEIVRMLLEKPEIRVNVQNQWGNTALMLASREGHTEIANLIKSHPNFKKP